MFFYFGKLLFPGFLRFEGNFIRHKTWQVIATLLHDLTSTLLSIKRSSQTVRRLRWWQVFLQIVSCQRFSRLSASVLGFQAKHILAWCRLSQRLFLRSSVLMQYPLQIMSPRLASPFARTHLIFASNSRKVIEWDHLIPLIILDS